MSDRLIKLNFRLIQDDDDYPPVAVESVWSRATSNAGEYMLGNVPFFAREATMGDVVRAREEDGCLWFESVVARSQNSLIRIVFFDRSSVDPVNESLVKMGCLTEFLKEYNILAVSVSRGINLQSVQAYLQAAARAGVLDYEEPILRQ